MIIFFQSTTCFSRNNCKIWKGTENGWIDNKVNILDENNPISIIKPLPKIIILKRYKETDVNKVIESINKENVIIAFPRINKYILSWIMIIKYSDKEKLKSKRKVNIIAIIKMIINASKTDKIR